MTTWLPPALRRCNGRIDFHPEPAAEITNLEASGLIVRVPGGQCFANIWWNRVDWAVTRGARLFEPNREEGTQLVVREIDKGRNARRG